MQSSLWSNPSSIFTQQQQQQQQQQSHEQHQQQQQQQPPHHHHYHQDSSALAPNEDVCPHLKVMRRPLGGDRDHPRHQQQLSQTRIRTPPPIPIPLPPPPLFACPVGRLTSSGSFRATNIDEEADAEGTISEAAPAVASASAVSFPLLSVDTCVRQSISTTAAHPLLLVPLVTRQQGYVQQEQQKSFSQHQQQQQQQTQVRQHCFSTASATEEDLRHMLHRKRIRYRALIVAYLTFMLLFVLAVVFLSAFGVFHTAGSETGAQSGAPVIPSERPAAGVRQGASP